LTAGRVKQKEEGKEGKRKREGIKKERQNKGRRYLVWLRFDVAIFQRACL
jgi:hypothetical protein